MIFFLIIIIAILFYGMQVKPRNEFHTDYCSRKQTSTINGIFSLLIFLSHASQYTVLGGALDNPYLAMRKYLGQIVVASFLFYSGYGMMESINKKGTSYVKDIPYKRLFKVWYHYAIVVILFIIVDVIFSRHYTPVNVLLSFTGLTTVGNSNWYLFITFAMYIIIYASFMMFKNNKYLALTAVVLLTGAFAAFEWKMKMGARFYNTIFCFPAGMVFSVFKTKTDKLVMKNDIIWAACLALTFGAYFAFEKPGRTLELCFNAFAILAVALIMMINMKVKIENPILDFFGSHIFSFFILQRIPMIIFYELGLAERKYTFIIASFIATILICQFYDMLMAKLDAKIYKKA